MRSVRAHNPASLARLGGYFCRLWSVLRAVKRLLAPASRTRVACDPDRYTVIHLRFGDFPPLVSAPRGTAQDSHSVAIAAMREFMKQMRTQLEKAA
jgi:hypothetical protein